MIFAHRQLHHPGIGDITYPPGGTYGPRRQNALQLVYLYSGSVEIRIDDTLRVVEANEATLLLPGHQEYFEFDRNTDSRHGWVQLSPDVVTDEAREFIDSIPAVLPFSTRMRRLVDQALPIRHLRSQSDLHRLQGFAELIMAEYVSQAQQDSHGLLPHAVRCAYSYIEQHYADTCALDTLAEVANISKAHLIRLFTRHLGATPAKIVWQIRLDRAEELLRTSGLSVKEIAAATGFQTSNHLSRRFRQRFGLAPVGYRKQHWGS